MVKMTTEKLVEILISLSRISEDINSFQISISLSHQTGDIENNFSKHTQILEKIYYDFRGIVTEMYKFDHEIRSKQQ